MDAQNALVMHEIGLAKSHGSTPIVWTTIPTNPTVAGHDYNATDSYRVAYNNTWRGYGGAGITIADFDVVMAGTTDGDGQVNIKVGYTDDGIHPNATGHPAMGVVALKALKPLLPLFGFNLGTLVTPTS
jgi:lysophospholipase L1-like esterase